MGRTGRTGRQGRTRGSYRPACPALPAFPATRSEVHGRVEPREPRRHEPGRRHVSSAVRREVERLLEGGRSARVEDVIEIHPDVGTPATEELDHFGEPHV